MFGVLMMLLLEMIVIFFGIVSLKHDQFHGRTLHLMPKESRPKKTSWLLLNYMKSLSKSEKFKVLPRAEKIFSAVVRPSAVGLGYGAWMSWDNGLLRGRLSSSIGIPETWMNMVEDENM